MDARYFRLQACTYSSGQQSQENEEMCRRHSWLRQGTGSAVLQSRGERERTCSATCAINTAHFTAGAIVIKVHGPLSSACAPKGVCCNVLHDERPQKPRNNITLEFKASWVLNSRDLDVRKPKQCNTNQEAQIWLSFRMAHLCVCHSPVAVFSMSVPVDIP